MENDPDRFSVSNRGWPWLAPLGGLLIGLAALVGVALRESGGWKQALVLAAIGGLAIAWSVFGAVRCIEFGESIVVRRGRRERVIPWEEVVGVSFDMQTGTMRT
jgi:hypothetical protein